ncbi:MAG: hypothetical protein LBF21_02580 [Puniceicoccales bacterium]|nr:hypothetical protein [Puniceicoccales bacterium]
MKGDSFAGVLGSLVFLGPAFDFEEIGPAQRAARDKNDGKHHFYPLQSRPHAHPPTPKNTPSEKNCLAFRKKSSAAARTPTAVLALSSDSEGIARKAGIKRQTQRVCRLRRQRLTPKKPEKREKSLFRKEASAGNIF